MSTNEVDQLVYGMHKVLKNRAEYRAKQRKKYVKRTVLSLLSFVLGILLCYFFKQL